MSHEITVGGVLPPDHYRVHVSYAPIPSLADLKQEFGEDNVSTIFDGRRWELHHSCADTERSPGWRIFYNYYVGRDWEMEELIAWGLAQRNAVAPNGYRPATHDEKYEFEKDRAELVNFVALGSSTLSEGRRCVARLWGYIAIASWVAAGSTE